MPLFDPKNFKKYFSNKTTGGIKEEIKEGKEEKEEGKEEEKEEEKEEKIFFCKSFMGEKFEMKEESFTKTTPQLYLYSPKKGEGVRKVEMEKSGREWISKYFLLPSTFANRFFSPSPPS